MISAAIFDVDGTLVDSVDLHALAWKDAFHQFGHDIAFTDIRSQIGKGGDQLLPVFLSETDLAAFGKRLEQRRGEIFKSTYLDKVQAFPHVRALFERLAADRVATAVASSAKPDELEVYLRLADLDGLVDVRTSSGDAERSKPHPDIFEAALAKLGDADRRRIVVIGDSPYDARAADAAGLRAIGVLCGGFAEADLREAGYVALYGGPDDLLARYDEWTSQD